MRIEGMKFVPERLEVAAGDRITWVNRDIVPHSVTAQAASIESGDMTEGRSFSYVAKAAGEIQYICRLHPTMRATLAVK
ncbi:MAG TPA: cupredoxin family copper-binding protein [Burkholderiales bacterium]|nr:cupredoxin family copper-binding protein [Burkholderiales bacterium]